MNMHANMCQEVAFSRGERLITAKRWNRGGRPTLALHGWLDNANSFNFMAPRLTELDLVALDFAGHGHSDHRPVDCAYNADADIEDILFVAEQLGWQEFSVIGHSMGAEYGSQLVGLFPDRVNHLVCVDGFASAAPGDKMLEMRARRIAANLRPKTVSTKVYASVAEMIERVVNATGQQLESVTELIERGHRRVEGGVSWATDPRLKTDAWDAPDPAQLLELAKRTTAPTLLIKAGGGHAWYADSLRDVAEVHPRLQQVEIAGSHHLHMEEPAAGQVVAQIRDFLGLKS